MKTWAGLIFCFLFSAGSLNAEPTTVPSVDLQRYLGKWYEIGTIPQSFQKGCQCVTAEYSLREDGQIGVINSCRKDAPTGKLKLAKGRAKIEDKVSNAKLRVTFFWPFYGDYWIIGLDANYRYALVSDRKGKTLWLLSRSIYHFIWIFMLYCIPVENFFHQLLHNLLVLAVNQLVGKTVGQ